LPGCDAPKLRARCAASDHASKPKRAAVALADGRSVVRDKRIVFKKSDLHQPNDVIVTNAELPLAL
jgi:hypothetical protein